MHSNRHLQIYSVFVLIFVVIIGSSAINHSIDDNVPIEKKTERCKQMLAKLAKVSGLKSIEIPDIEVVKKLKNGNLAIAMFINETRPKIQIHKYTYDICMEDLGKDSLNCLAFILGHELTHYTKKHLDRQLFVTQDSIFKATTKNVIKDRSALDSIARLYRGISEKFNIRKNESEADLYAGFTAYLAGYNTKHAGPKFLEFAYSDFELNTGQGKYVSLAERQEIARKTGEKLDTLIRVFEMGNLLSIAGEYDMATTCYTYIKEYFSSPALLNNIGLSIMLSTTDHADNEILPYNLPYTIDVNFIELPDKAPPIDGDGTSEPIIGALHWVEPSLKKLNAAIDYFKSVQLTHPSNYEAYLNQSIAEYLIYTYSTADITVGRIGTDDHLTYAFAAAHKAKNLLLFDEQKKKALSDVFMMLAVLEHTRANQEMVVKYYDLCKDENANNSFLKSNKFMVEPEIGVSGTTRNSSFNTDCSEETETISNLGVNTFFNAIDSFDIDLNLGFIDNINSPVDLQVTFKSKSFDIGYIYNISLFDTGVKKQDYTVFETNENYPGKSACNMKTGQSLSRLEIAYGENPRMLESSAGTYRSFSKQPIDESRTDGSKWKGVEGAIFYSNNSEKVDRWYMFKKSDRLN